MPNSKWHIRQRGEVEAQVPVLVAVQDFLATTDVKRLEQRTQDEYTYVLTTFAHWCAAHSLVQNKKDSTWSVTTVRQSYDPICLHRVNAQAVHLFLEHVALTHKPSKATAEQISSHTLANYAKNIKRFLNWCLLDEQYCHHVQAITVQRVKKPKIEQIIIEVFTAEQLDALFRACEQEESEHLQVRDRAILAMLLDTGIRAKELVTLTIGNVSLDSKDAHVKVLGKGRKWGEVGLGEQARRAIGRYIRMFREPTVEYEVAKQARKQLPERQLKQLQKQTVQHALVFVNRSGKPLTKSGLYQIIVRLGEWADIQGVRCSPHTFRHTFAVLFWRKTHDIRTLSKLLRHSSLSVTEHYLRSILQSEARQGAPSVLDEL